MTDWQSTVVSSGAGAAFYLLYYISRNIERLLEEAKRIRIAVERDER